MRVFKKLVLGLLFIVAASLAGASTIMAQSRTYGSFYEELAPYGRWTTYRHYGSVWIPNVERGFQPYATRGHWVLTEYGNTWVSDYDWGWAAFHYGRWTFDNYYGWIWIPGDEWGPAWVSWRSDNDYYGWAPLGPGVDISIPTSRWIFVPKRYVTHRNVYNYCVPSRRVTNIYRHTTVINNIYVNNNRKYFAGPHRNDIERATKSRVIVHRIDDNPRPSRAETHNGSVRIYRPEIRERNKPSNHPDHLREQHNSGNRSPYREEYRPGSGNTQRPDSRNPNPSSDKGEKPNQRPDDRQDKHRKNVPGSTQNNPSPQPEQPRGAGPERSRSNNGSQPRERAYPDSERKLPPQAQPETRNSPSPQREQPRVEKPERSSPNTGNQSREQINREPEGKSSGKSGAEQPSSGRSRASRGI